MAYDQFMFPGLLNFTNVKVVADLQTSVTRLLSSRYQDVFALLVPSCCDKSGTSCYHIVTRLMTITDLLQVIPTRLIQAVRNKLLPACSHHTCFKDFPVGGHFLKRDLSVR
jgi:hypothetical protein